MFDQLSGLMYLFSHESEIISLNKEILLEMSPERRQRMALDIFVQLREREQKLFHKIFPTEYQTAIGK